MKSHPHSAAKLEGVLERLAQREISPRQAIEELVTLGLGLGDAGETVLFALGGSDLIEIGADGRRRFHGSGKLVSEVEAEMDRPASLPLSKTQRRTVEKLVAQGWPQGAAELMAVTGQEDVIEDGGCEMIAMRDCSAEAAKVFARFWWSEAQGLTSDNEEVASRLAAEGIATPPAGGRVFPRDGRKFFDALRWRGSSYVQITLPRKVPRQQGQSVR